MEISFMDNLTPFATRHYAKFLALGLALVSLPIFVQDAEAFLSGFVSFGFGSYGLVKRMGQFN